MNYEYYKIFYCVGKHKNITRAAAELYSSQPAVTRVIHNLENDLGCKLFVRTKSGVEFTHEGELLFEYVSAACHQFIRGEEELSRAVGADGGIVHIGATVTALHCFLFEFLDRYNAEFPNVRFKIRTSSSDKAIESLKSGAVDLAFVTTPHAAQKPLVSTEIKRFRDILIAGRKYAALKEKTVGIKQLRDYPFVGLSKGMQQREFVDGLFSDMGISVSPDIETDSADLIVPMVEHGLGLALIPEDMAQEALARGNVIVLNTEEALPERSICVVSDPTHPQSRASRELLRLIRSQQ